MSPAPCSPFDAEMLASGPPAVFVVDHQGDLRFDVQRTRDAWSRVTGPVVRGVRHCLFRDLATGWVQYILVSSPALCVAHPRAEIRVYKTADDALAALAALGGLPVSRVPLAE